MTQKRNDFDTAFDRIASAFTVPILRHQHVEFIDASNRFVLETLPPDPSSGSPRIGVTNPTTKFEEASPELRLLLSKAIYRLGLWIDTLVASEHRQGGELPLPPIDVLIILNAYMLSPRPFLEDVRVRDLPALQTFPIREIVRWSLSTFRPLEELISPYESGDEDLRRPIPTDSTRHRVLEGDGQRPV